MAVEEFLGEGRKGAWQRKQLIGEPKGGRRRRGASSFCHFVSNAFRARRAPQINLGRLETYRSSGRLVIALLQGCIRVMSFLKNKNKNKKAPTLVSTLMRDTRFRRSLKFKDHIPSSPCWLESVAKAAHT